MMARSSLSPPSLPNRGDLRARCPPPETRIERQVCPISDDLLGIVGPDVFWSF